MLALADYNFKRGSKLVVELVNGDILEGTLYNGGKSRLDLINIKIYSSDYSSKGPYSYYQSEIKSVRVVKEKPQENGEITNGECYIEANKTLISIPKEDYEDLILMTKNYIYLPMIDVNYYSAIKHLKTCENLGIAAITNSYDKFDPLSLLVISSWDQVYIFDIQSFGIPNDLKDILESNHIKKVCHDSRLPWGILKNQHNINLNNIFDTLCADISIQEKTEKDPEKICTRSIGQCFQHYFNFPENFMNIYKTSKWGKRPLSEQRKSQASQLGAYLVYLKNHLERIMFKTFFETSSRFASSFRIPCNSNSKIDGKLILDIKKKLSL
ncbi:piRNA biogenesis protein EXD1-like [Onthophagus taurus]|uniref:piRNA biogenesis protein EXD1-like n=1 Tax=Onthophagus taurus TaxID=166361 RepID=UPI0039BEA197